LIIHDLAPLNFVILLLEIDSLHISPEDQEEKDDAGNLIPEGFLDDLELPEL
jgi:hypothetical protein